MTTATLLQEEVRHYDAKRQELLASCQERFALIEGARLVGAFEDEDSAIAEGIRMFGLEPFLVKQVLAQEPVRYFPFDLGPGLNVSI